MYEIKKFEERLLSIWRMTHGQATSIEEAYDAKQDYPKFVSSKHPQWNIYHELTLLDEFKMGLHLFPDRTQWRNWMTNPVLLECPPPPYMDGK